MKNVKLYTCKALIIDDNEINTNVLANMLRLYLIDVDQASSGTQALKMLNRVEYDLVFVDHNMPDMDGVQTTKDIRTLKNNKNSVIFALTSGLSDEVRDLYLYAGANEVYAKPLGLTELDRILQLWCPQLTLETSPIPASVQKSNEAIEITVQSKDAFIPMTIEEYEQSICNTIYYIRRYDYVAIVNELEKLIRQEHSFYQPELKQAVAEIKDYNYEKILNRMLELKDRINKINSSIEEEK